MKYFSKNHSKFHICYHFILVVKYRKSILNYSLVDELSKLFKNIETTSDFEITTIGFDKNHVHLIVYSPPTISPLQIVRKLKQETTVNIWKTHGKTLQTYFWKEQTLWTDGYFVCTCGEISEDIINRYVENQG